MKFKKLLSITKPYHLTYKEVKKLPPGEVVLLVTPKRLIHYVFEPENYLFEITDEGVVVPLELLEHYAQERDSLPCSGGPGIYKRDHLRRVRVVGCVLEDTLNYGDLGEGLALMALPKF